MCASQFLPKFKIYRQEFCNTDQLFIWKYNLISWNEDLNHTSTSSELEVINISCFEMFSLNLISFKHEVKLVLFFVFIKSNSLIVVMLSCKATFTTMFEWKWKERKI